MRVTVFRTGSLGDTVCAIPAFRLLRSNFADARLTLLCDGASGTTVSAPEVVGGLGIFDAILTYPARKSWLSGIGLAKQLLRARPDVAVLLPQARETEESVWRKVELLRALGIRRIIGGWEPPPAGQQPKEPERLVQLLRLAGLQGPTPAYAIEPAPQARRDAAALLAQAGIPGGTPYLVFCGGGKTPSQRWPLERYAEVLARVHARYGLPILAIGSRPDLQQYGAAGLGAVQGLRMTDAAFSIPELFEVFRNALAYFGNDTGPAHVAAAVQCPVAAVISGRNFSGAWDPDVEPSLVFRHRTDCQGCFLSACTVRGHECMTAIEAPEVAAGLIAFLAPLLEGRACMASV